MKKSAKKIFNIFFIGLLSIFYVTGIYLLFSTITVYKPLKTENIALYGNHAGNDAIGDELTLLSWNIGCAVSSKEMDHCFAGGKKRKPAMDSYQKSLNGILNTLVKYSYVDFVLLQEVDVLSNRSYFSNQKNMVSEFLPDFDYAYALDEDVKCLVWPLYAPMGRIKSGLQTLMKYKPNEIKRYAYAVHYDWPKSLFMPSPCFLVARYSLANGRQLVLINSNHSDSKQGLLAEYEMDALKIFVCKEYDKGNYVIAGGDWGILHPPDSSNVKMLNKSKVLHSGEIAAHYMPSGWQWAYDAEIPSMRHLNKADQLKSTLTMVNDFYLLSPNIETLSIRNIDMNFAFSNHNPVLINVKLN